MSKLELFSKEEQKFLSNFDGENNSLIVLIRKIAGAVLYILGIYLLLLLLLIVHLGQSQLLVEMFEIGVILLCASMTAFTYLYFFKVCSAAKRISAFIKRLLWAVKNV
jgi:hypothetical protein